MAFCKRLRRWLIAAGTITVAAAFFLGTFAHDASAARQSPKRHFTSQESHGRPDQYKRAQARPRSARRFRVSTDRIAALKKSSFWNKRPYQFATPLIDGDRLFVGVDAGIFFAFDVRTNKRLWQQKTDGPVHGKAAYAEGTVYAADAEGHVYAMDAASGEKRWMSVLDTDILATPLVEGGRIYVATMSGRLYALDAGTGTELWHTNPQEKEFGFSIRRASSPVSGGGLIYYGTSSGELLAVRESDGRPAWSELLGAQRSQVYDVDSSPLLYNGRLYASTADGTLSCIEPASGKILWTIDAGGVNDSISRDGKIFASGGGSLFSINPDSGLIFWQQDLEVPEISSPAAGEHYVAVTSADEKIYLIDSDSGDIAYERYIGRGSYGDPIVSGDKIYLLSNTGKLYSFKVRELAQKEKAAEKENVKQKNRGRKK
ncbi:MAG: PQQ-binding-like beta-propeller repeat protein [bacterium]